MRGNRFGAEGLVYLLWILVLWYASLRSGYFNIEYGVLAGSTILWESYFGDSWVGVWCVDAGMGWDRLDIRKWVAVCIMGRIRGF